MGQPQQPYTAHSELLLSKNEKKKRINECASSLFHLFILFCFVHSNSTLHFEDLCKTSLSPYSPPVCSIRESKAYETIYNMWKSKALPKIPVNRRAYKLLVPLPLDLLLPVPSLVCPALIQTWNSFPHWFLRDSIQNLRKASSLTWHSRQLPLHIATSY